MDPSNRAVPVEPLLLFQAGSGRLHLICRILDDFSDRLERDVSYVEAYVQGKD